MVCKNCGAMYNENEETRCPNCGKQSFYSNIVDYGQYAGSVNGWGTAQNQNSGANIYNNTVPNNGINGYMPNGKMHISIPKLVLAVFLIITGILVSTSVFMPLLSGEVDGHKESCNIIDEIKGIVSWCDNMNSNIDAPACVLLISIFLSAFAGVMVSVFGLCTAIIAIVSVTRIYINDTRLLLSRFKGLVIAEFAYLLALDNYRFWAYGLQAVSDDEYSLSLRPGVGWWLPAAFSVTGLLLAIVFVLIDSRKEKTQGKLMNSIMGGINLIFGMALSLMAFVPFINEIISRKNESLGLMINDFFASACILWDRVNSHNVGNIIAITIACIMLITIFALNVHLIRKGINGILKNRNYSAGIIVIGAIDLVFAIAAYILIMVALEEESEYFKMGAACIVYIVLGTLLIVEGILHKVSEKAKLIGGSAYQGYNNNINAGHQQNNSYPQQNSSYQQQNNVYPQNYR